MRDEVTYSHLAPARGIASRGEDGGGDKFSLVNEAAFIDKLAELRARAGLSQRDLAESMHTDPSTISKIEAGQRAPGWTTLWDWLRACGGHGLDIAGAAAAESERDRALLDAARDVEEDDVWILAEAIRGLAAVQGEDRAMARIALKWLASHAQPASEASGTLEDRVARLEASANGDPERRIATKARTVGGPRRGRARRTNEKG
jgi:transcriptional regulator with XRE-family HTH domain